MRICHVITRLIVGGAQENTLLTCEGLHQRGHDVLLLYGPDAGPEGTLWDRAANGGYRILQVPSLRRAIRPLDDCLAVHQLGQAYQCFDPDIIHTHSSKAGVVGRLAASKNRRSRVVHTIHGMSFNRTQSPPVRFLTRMAEYHVSQLTDHIVTVADAMTRQAVKADIAPPSKFTTVYSGMNTDWFKPDREKREAMRRQWHVGDDDIVVGTVARLFENKGYEQLIPAIASSASASPHLQFVWVGDGAHRQRYSDRLESLGLRRRVRMAGLLPPQRVADYIQGFDLLVHCSQWEGLPRALPQALLCGVPVISFDVDGAPEVVIDGQTGRLVPFNDVAELSHSILQLAESAELRRQMAQTGRAKCLKMFDHQLMVQQLEGIYERLVG